MAAILLVGFLLSPDTIFGFLETMATLAVIILYAMANLALTSYMRREQRARFTIWQHVVIPWIATLALSLSSLSLSTRNLRGPTA